MNRWAKLKPTPSILVAGLALFLALGGGAIAAKTKLKVRSVDIVNGQVKTPDLRNNSVTGAKIRNGQVGAADIGSGAVGASELAPGAVSAAALAPGAVGAAALQGGAVGGDTLAPNSVDSSKVKDGSLTGADVDESSLSGIDAQTLDGASRCGIAQRVTIGKGASDKQTLCTIGPFTLSSLCESDAGTSMLGAVQLKTSANDSFYSTDGVVAGFDEPSPSDPDLDAGEQVSVMWHTEFEEGDGPSVSAAVSFNAFAPSGQSISGSVSVRADSAVGGARICDFVVSAIG